MRERSVKPRLCGGPRGEVLQSHGNLLPIIYNPISEKASPETAHFYLHQPFISLTSPP